MKGLVPLFLGIFGTFAFSWVGLTVIPNLQIGHLDPQMEEDGSDVYPAPQSGMVERGRRVYAANGCIYCHSQQIRADYAAPDMDRTRDPDPHPKWGERRSAPRDYLFDRPVLLGKMRMGPDLANVGKGAPAEEENAAPAGAASPANSPGPQAAAPAASAAPSAANPNSPPTNAASPAPSASPGPAGSPAKSTSSPSASPTPKAPAPPAPNASPVSPLAPAAANASPAPSATPVAALPGPSAPATRVAVKVAFPGHPPIGPISGEPASYSAAWHHRHLYSPRSINIDSDMPAYRFLYQKRGITDAPSADALELTGSDAPREGWEVVPTYDAKCLVAYLMSLNQSHPLKEVRSAAPAPSPAPGKGATQ